jgi:hypothetical protein
MDPADTPDEIGIVRPREYRFATVTHVWEVDDMVYVDFLQDDPEESSGVVVAKVVVKAEVAGELIRDLSRIVGLD